MNTNFWYVTPPEDCVYVVGVRPTRFCIDMARRGEDSCVVAYQEDEEGFGEPFIIPALAASYIVKAMVGSQKIDWPGHLQWLELLRVEREYSKHMKTHSETA